MVSLELESADLLAIDLRHGSACRASTFRNQCRRVAAFLHLGASVGSALVAGLADIVGVPAAFLPCSSIALPPRPASGALSIGGPDRQVAPRPTAG